ncbi:MAG TPA: nickel pincer cofactor biosynthesis protein LarB [Pirellulales bacterium]|jgi:hypothetical protein|nr:nickel pincer cofactor biosynthesis protein LarB [Pirellulales bacterium]
MDENLKKTELERRARELAAGRLSVDEFVAAVLPAKTADLGEAQLDLDRGPRCGFPEVVFGEGKTVETLAKIFARFVADRLPLLATRVSAEKWAALRDGFPTAQYSPLGRTLMIIPPGAGNHPQKAGGGPKSSPAAPAGKVAIVTAGTGDLPVAEEARQTLLWMGIETVLVQDVGVAGPHRLRERLDELENADAVIVVAGMEGALPSVVGGYVPCPVIGVPTSVGYGASFGGVSALLSMLNSCAANVTVVNIDAGFKAAYVAGLIARRRAAAGS